MSVNNPQVTVSDIVSEVQIRLGADNISSTSYFPWISYAQNQLWQAICASGQRAKEEFFGTLTTLTLINGTSEYSISTNMPRFAGTIRVDVKYGGTSDEYVKATKLPSVADVNSMTNVSTQYFSKINPLYYILKDVIGFIPTPPSSDPGTAYAKIWYVMRPYQISSTSDTIDLPYQFIYPLTEYVYGRAQLAENEDLNALQALDSKFRLLLADITTQVANYFNENDESSTIRIPTT